MQGRVFSLLIIAVICLYSIKCQQFPPISNDGELVLDWSNQQVDNNNLQILMFDFTIYYQPFDLRRLYLNLNGNCFDNLKNLAVLYQYQQIELIQLQVGDNENLTFVADAITYLPDNINQITVSFKGSTKIIDYGQFLYNLQSKVNLAQLDLSFEKTNLTQIQHDFIYKQLSMYTNSELISLSLNFDQDQQFNDTKAIQYLIQLYTLNSLQITYPGTSNGFLQAINLTPVLKFVSQTSSIKNFSFSFDYFNLGEQIISLDWMNQITKLTNIEYLTYLLETTNNFFDENTYNYLIGNLSQLNQLKSLNGYIGCQYQCEENYDGEVLMKFTNLNQLTNFQLRFLNQIQEFNISFLNNMNQLANISLSLMLGFNQLDTQYLESITLQHLTMDLYSETIQRMSFVFQTPGLINLMFQSFSIVTNLQFTSSLDQLTFLGIYITEQDLEQFDCSTIPYSIMYSLETYELFVDNPINQDYLSSLSLLPNLTKINIFTDTFSNLTFIQSFNYMPSLYWFGFSYNVSHSYLYVDSQSVQSFQVLNCNDECLRCYGPSENQCISCLKYFLYKNECLATCPEGYHPNISTHTCDPNQIKQ